MTQQVTSIGPYVVIERLGSGGMGVVYRATHRGLGRTAAVKQPNAAVLADPDALARFRREARAAGNLNHPNIVCIYDVGLEEHPPWIAMEHVDGDSLEHRLESGKIPPHETIALLRPVAAALDHVHGKGLTHRDVKPANVLLGDGGRRPVLTDFGIVRYEGATPLTATGTALGTAGYLSPEQVEGAAAGPASDLYALACIAFRCLTGVLPFREATPLGQMLAHAKEPVPSASALNRRLPASVDDVLVAALAKDPKQRSADFPTVTAFVDALEKASAVPSTAVAGVRTDWRTDPRTDPLTVQLPVSEPLRAPAPVAPVYPQRARRPAEPAAPAPRRPWAAVLGVAVAVIGAYPAYVVGDAVFDRAAGAAAGPVAVTGDDVVKPGAVLSSAQRSLLEAGPLAHVTECEGQPTVESATVSAAVGCASTLPGVDGLLLRRTDPAALDEYMDSETRPEGNCSTSVGVDGDWAGGPLACYDNQSDEVHAVLWFGYRDSGISVLAVREDGDNAALHDWFTGTDWSSPAGPG